MANYTKDKAKSQQNGHESLAKVAILEFMNGKWPYVIDEDMVIANFSETGDFGKLGPTIRFIAEKWKRLPDDKKHAIKGWIEDLKNPEINRLLRDTPIGGSEQSGPLCPPLPKHLEYPPELAASACQWLDDYIAFSKKWSPRAHESYHEAVAFALLSTVAARRVMLDYGGPEYTPMFIALVGPTTLFTKSTTLKLYSGLLRAAGLDWLLGANIVTPQKLLSNMAGKHLPSNWEDLNEDQKTYIKKRLAFAAQIGWCYDEFGMHLDAMVKENGIMAEFKGLLRKIFDCEPFSYDTIRRGMEQIEKPYLSLVASLTLADIKPHADKNNKFYRDGLLARFVFPCPPKGTKSKRTQFPKEKLIYPTELIMPLVRWHQWLGEPDIEIDEQLNKDKTAVIKRTVCVGELPEQECTLPDEVREHIIAYENALKDMMESESPIPEDLFGNYGRLPIIALHAAMLLASIDNQGYIELRHWARARQFIETCRDELHGMYNQTTVSEDEDNSYEARESQLEDTILIKMTELAEKGEEWLTPNDLFRYLKKPSREKIGDKMKSLAKHNILEEQKTNRTIKYKVVFEE